MRIAALSNGKETGARILQGTDTGPGNHPVPRYLGQLNPPSPGNLEIYEIRRSPGPCYSTNPYNALAAFRCPKE